jgi:hypothetical protein
MIELEPLDEMVPEQLDNESVLISECCAQPLMGGGGFATDDCIVEIRPIGASGDSHGEPPHASHATTPLHQLLTKQLQVPIFTNKKCDWDDFVWSFEDFLQKMDGGRPLAEKTKLQALEMAMPLPIQNEIKLMKRQMDPQVVHGQMMKILEKRFGEGRSIGKRQKWREVELFNGGKISANQFRDFENSFKLC